MDPSIVITTSASGRLEFWHNSAIQKMGGVQQQSISVRSTLNDMYETTIYWDVAGEFWYISEDFMADFAPKMEITSKEAALLFVEALWLDGLAKGY